MAGRWSRLFPAGEFRWSIGLRPGDARAFFASTAEHQEILVERARWLDETPGECALLTEGGVPLLSEVLALGSEWGSANVAESDGLHVAVLQRLGRAWEPDFVLLSHKEDQLTVEGGVVCFPSSWSLREKLGHSLDFTHSIVPDLNTQLAPRIRQALSQLAPGAAWERENWGLSRDAERNHFIGRPLRRLDASVTPEEVWLRIERQVLVKMPSTGGILFGIRLEIAPWLEVVSDPEAVESLKRALSSMPAEAAHYKGIHEAREVILHWLG